VAALRDGLAVLLANDELASRFGEEGRRHVVKNMDIRDCMARLEAIYEHHAFSHLSVAGAPGTLRGKRAPIV
jgi:glycosyltransferase involved in cell wall biosynthesis